MLEELRARNHFSTTKFLGIKGMDGRGDGLVYGGGRHLQGMQVFLHVIYYESIQSCSQLLFNVFYLSFMLNVELVGN